MWYQNLVDLDLGFYKVLVIQKVKKKDARIFNTVLNVVGLKPRLKFVNEGEDNQVYGMSIPDVMVNNDIKNSKAYQPYLAISTRVVILKKARKGMKTSATPNKKGLITIEKNIISKPDEAIELAVSMSRTEANIVDEE
nr:hypothetical protein [Tanacetum cinerariifolium]